jgi:hypothetical protein
MALKPVLIERPSKTEKSGRDAKGRFAIGNPGGPGRQKGFSTELQLAFTACFTVEDIQRLAKRLKQLADAGSLKAIEIILNRTCGPLNPLFDVSQQAESFDGYNADERYL